MTTAFEFANCIAKEVVDENMSTYKELIRTPPHKLTDPVWKQLTEAYNTMTRDQQIAILVFARQVIVDTASNLLGILDGNVILHDYRKEFSLKYGESNEKLNGDLQDQFLAIVGMPR
jgi:hypothetical protein